ncbi:MAG TPA: ATP-binding protein [Mycobacterium sp.]|nr:ATP-binding protein [Mycobacterium sp.]
MTGRTVRRPSRWSVSNWPVLWKVLAIALVPMVLATVFGALRVSAAVTDADRLRTAADRAEMIPAINDYLAALGNTLVAASSGGDLQGAKKNFENRKYGLQSRLAKTDAATDVRSAVTTLVQGGQALVDQVLSGNMGLREQVTAYAPFLLTAEDAINGSVRVDDERVRAETEGLSRAVGARGQMMMQQLLVNRGGELPDPDLRTSMMALAGTEPSTLFGMSQVLGVDSPDAKQLQQQMVARLAIMSDPESVLPNNPELRDSIHSTDEIAARVIQTTTTSVTTTLADRAADRRHVAIRDGALVLAAIVAAVLIVGLVARSLVQPLRTLRDSALRVAHTDLENEIARVQAGDEREPPPLPVYTTEEVGQVAHAVDELHARALLLAGDEARLRSLVNEMFETMARRNRSLVDQQLSLIDRLERDEDDPERLDSLFRLDHLAARMRRNGVNLMVLSGAQQAHDTGRPMPLSTVISAATSEVEAYRRVEALAVADATLAGVATGDTIHLLAELIDNALRYSPPAAPVRVSAERTEDGGAVIEVIDSGLGMTETDLRLANTRLGAIAEVNPEHARRMGLYVVGRLARRHGITVQLTSTALASPMAGASPAASGIVAEVYLPPGLLVGGVGAEPSAVKPERATAVPPAPSLPFGRATVAPGADGKHNGSQPHEPAGLALPTRSPGSSGITGAPAGRAEPEQAEPEQSEPERITADAPPAPVAANGDPNDDLIYQRMLSEWLVDPRELGRSADLDWKSVWDHGWSAAEEVEDVPVEAHTESGLPVRRPGVRLVPGAADPQPAVASNGAERQPTHRAPERDPAAVRASIGSHFGRVRAARSHARHEREPDSE